MLEVRCTGKKRDKNNNIIAYRLVDRTGAVKILKPCEVKQYIKQGKIRVVNLTLTKDGRLVDGAKVPVRVVNKARVKSSSTGEQPVVKKFSQLTEAEKEWVVSDIMSDTECYNREFADNLTTLYNDDTMETFHSKVEKLAAKLKAAHSLNVRTEGIDWRTGVQGICPVWDFSFMFYKGFNLIFDDFNIRFNINGYKLKAKVNIEVVPTDANQLFAKWGGDNETEVLDFSKIYKVAVDEELINNGVVIKVDGVIRFVGYLHSKEFKYAFGKLYAGVSGEENILIAVNEAVKLQEDKLSVSSKAIIEGTDKYSLNTSKGYLTVCSLKSAFEDTLVMDSVGTVVYMGEPNTYAFTKAVVDFMGKKPNFMKGLQNWCNRLGDTFEFDDTPQDTASVFTQLIGYSWAERTDEQEFHEDCEGYTNPPFELFPLSQASEIRYTIDIVPDSVKAELKEYLRVIQKFIDDVWALMQKMCTGTMTKEWLRNTLETNDYEFIKFKGVLRYVNN